MKYVRMFDAVVGLFPKMIKVKMVDVGTESVISEQKIPAEQLPAAFDRPTFLEIAGVKWRVLKADPVSADDFHFSKKLTLHVHDAESIDGRQFHFNVPTICNKFPLTGPQCLFNDFSLELSGDDWGQIEFRKLNSASLIEEEVERISRILTGQPNALLGYQQQQIRAEDSSTLNISFEAFCEEVEAKELGNIFFNNGGFVENGFALRSDSFTYYGIVESDRINTLCLRQFECVDDEFMRVVNKFALMLVDWCNANTLSIVPNEEGPEVVIKIEG